MRVHPRVTTVNYANATLRRGRYIPSISTRQTDATYDVKPGQTIVLTGLLNDEIEAEDDQSYIKNTAIFQFTPQVLLQYLT